MPRNNKKSREHSDFEQNFIVENAFKRNRRYLNFQTIGKVQHYHQATRRRPFSSSEKSVDQKINNSFLNTTAAFSDKVEQEIDKFKSRLNGISDIDQNQMNLSRRSMRSFSSNGSRQKQNLSSRSLTKKNHSQSKKIRGMALDKYCSRQQYYQSKSKPVIDQRLFNNYTEMKSDLIHMRDFQKYLGRQLDLSLKNFNELQYNTQKLYEQYYYKKTSMQCNFDYKTQVIKPRQLVTPKRPQDLAATVLQPQKVAQSQKKCRKSDQNIEQFYLNTGRELPTQLQNRLNTNLTNHWVDNRGKILKKSKQYSLRIMKNDLVQGKLNELAQSKRPKFKRQQLCDQMYFRIYPHV